VIAVLAFDAGEAVVENAAINLVVNHLPHIGAAEALPGAEALVVALLESLEMMLDALVILGLLRFAGAVFRGDGRHRISVQGDECPQNTGYPIL
jgi:hypothetical protein